MSNVIYAPLPVETEDLTIFLAGSIEQGKADKWQDKITNIFKEVPHITFLNPRRQDWDPTWGDDHPELIEQIKWELNSLRHSDLAIFYFDPNTKSPITLLELGQHLERAPERALVCCPDGYWRRTNVRVTCEIHGVKMLDTFEELIEVLAIKLLEAAQGEKEKAYMYLPVSKHSSEKLVKWMEENKIPNPVLREKLHCTVVYSKASELPDYELLPYGTTVEPPYHFDIFGSAFVLRFEHADANEQWTKAREMGSQPDFDTYKPHITLSYDINGFNTDDLTPPTFSITFDSEVRGT
jgi:hypothetical protein